MNNIIDILKNCISNFQVKTVKGITYFTCPNIHKFRKDQPTATIINGNTLYCFECGYKISVNDLLKQIEIQVQLYPELEFYANKGWYLLQLGINSKIPTDQWEKITYNDKNIWQKWLTMGHNLGLITGEVNKITVIDVDVKNTIVEDIKKEREELILALENINTLIQITPSGGKHYIFNYTPELAQLQRNPLSNRKIDLMNIDIRNNGGYVVVAPSMLNNSKYFWLDLNKDVKTIPNDILHKLLNYIKVENGRKVVINTDFDITTIKEGEGRNNLLISLGGTLSHKFSIEQTAEILDLISKTFFKPPLAKHEIIAMLKQLDKYRNTDELTKEQVVYEYLKLVQNDVSARDVMDYTGYSRAIVDKYLSKFVKEGKAIRLSKGRYKYREKIEWTMANIEKRPQLVYSVPYFNDIAHFESGDIIVIGGKTSAGKTTLAMNFIKLFKEQGIKPYYIPLEAGARHYKIAETLGLSSEDYYIPKDPIVNPLSIEIEPNAITIIDWLLVQEKEHTDVIFKYLSDEMIRKGGLLIIFVQLKENNDYFAPNMTTQFARFACRYILDSDDGTMAHFQIDKITDPKGNIRSYTIPCTYNFETKLVQVTV